MKKVVCGLIISLVLLSNVDAAIYNAPCKVNQDCIRIYNDAYQCTDGHCIRQPITFTWKEILGIGIIFVVASIANAAGLGAGPVLVPVYMFLFKFVATDSIPLSKIAILSGSIVNTLVYWSSRHPKSKNRFIINYPLASCMVPLLIGGTMIGVMLSKLLPPVFILGSLIIYLLLSIWKIFKKASSSWKKEKEEREIFSSDLKNTVQTNSMAQSNTLLSVNSLESKSQTLSTWTLTKKELINILFMVLAYLVILGTAILRGGEGTTFKYQVEMCSFSYWGLLIIAQLACIQIGVLSYLINKRRMIAEDKGSGEDIKHHSILSTNTRQCSHFLDRN